MTDKTPPEDLPDDKTFSMFGDEESGSDSGYLVLARKYRPTRFEDLVGQDAMVRTLSNAFKTGRIAHAFMLTGVRGVGKTTTARLLARALNYESEDHDGPTTNLTPLGRHCKSIMESSHPDVLELDAASRTGVSDMRDLLEGVKFAPISASYKVYIIDEVHMLSTAAFNALLKTLEEPPPHVKFVLATTEIRKVPVTVLSRCQRFDLKRLDVPTLSTHLANVCEKENAKIDTEALDLIARAAEGSVRDGLSILDQAILQAQQDGELNVSTVRDMLGLADRTRLLELFAHAASGDHKAVLSEMDHQLANGADPIVILKDVMDICQDVNRAAILGDDYNATGPSDWIERTKSIAAQLTPAKANRYWQILLKGFEQASASPDRIAALEMALLRISSAANLPSPEDAARMIASGTQGGSASGQSGPSHAQGPHANPTSFAEVLSLMDARKKVDLHYDVERYVRPAEVRKGYLSCEVIDGASEDLLNRLKNFLDAQTGIDWTIEQVRSEAETQQERRAREHRERIASAEQHPSVREALDLFPGAKIVEVQEPTRANGETVVEVDFNSTRKPAKKA